MDTVLVAFCESVARCLSIPKDNPYVHFDGLCRLNSSIWAEAGQRGKERKHTCAELIYDDEKTQWRYPFSSFFEHVAIEEKTELEHKVFLKKHCDFGIKKLVSVLARYDISLKLEKQEGGSMACFKNAHVKISFENYGDWRPNPLEVTHKLHDSKYEMKAPLTEIAIEQHEFVPEEPKPETSKKNCESPSPTASQFLADYNAMKTCDPEIFGKYLLTLDVKQIPEITSVFLEGYMLSAILRGLRAVQSNVSSDDLAERLVAVSMSPGFDVAAMFLDESEKGDLEAMFPLFEKEKADLLRQRYL
ncbi:hypothetical protein QR680_012125 [Steinernema hermaphroditum]|uniref:RNA-polymerase II-associated protein 3-like C-terminal domain-containing protein n=1 Tax=Steinernema hermaphroditum TaxID=289476 RepID=A0AA39I3B5_9BILA|nr:hypothetical protein QR680_012125 [Steinernema hermaphroditum]